MTVGRFDDHPAAADEHADGTFPCTMLQERFWKLIQAGHPYGLNVAMRWLVQGRLSQAVAEHALQSLVDRHEILRTAFREVDGKVVQTIKSDCAIRLRTIDLSVFSPAQAEARAEEIAKAEALELMDPGRAPLLRATMLRLAPDRSVLLLTFHAMVADGWSIGLAMQEFNDAARAMARGTVPHLVMPDLQFADYALWERELLASDALDEAREYWRRNLQGATGTVVPPDRQKTVQRGDRGEIFSILVPPELSKSVDDFARRHNATLFSMAVAALALSLHRVTGDSEIVFGSQVANREEPAAEAVAGPTVNSITLRLPIDRNAPLQVYARAVADMVLEALQHQRLPFEIASTFAPSDRTRPLHAINLVVHRSYSGTSDTERADADFTLVSLPSYSSGTQWDLNFYLIGRDEGWRMSCEADTDLYDAATVQELLHAWLACLRALVSSPDRRVADCPAFGGIRARVPVGDRNLPSPGSRTPIPVHEPSRQIVRFHDDGAKTPVIVMNNRSVYYQLARRLGTDRPFIDIQAYHPDGPLDLTGCTFDDFATYAVKLIRWAQPHGPYVLGGHCVYGALAFEAARLLQQKGEKILLVALFDTWAPGYREAMPAEDRAKRQRQIRTAVRLRQLLRFWRREIGLREIVWNPILHRLGRETPSPPSEADLFAGRWFDDCIYAAAARHRPQPLSVDTVLFRSRETLRGRLFDERMGWGPLVTGTLVKTEIDSAHLDMFREKPAADIASFLNDRLGKLEGLRRG